MGGEVLRDFEQKGRNKPITITDIAIQKVRKTKIFGFVEDENRYIQEAHKRLLQISKEENNSEEVAVVIDIIQWEEEIVLGKGNRVHMEDNPNAYQMIVKKNKNIPPIIIQNITYT